MSLGTKSWWILVAAVFWASSGLAERRRPRPGPLRTQQQAPKSKLTGGVAIRPTWQLADETFYLENSAGLGLKVRDGVEIGYNQDFNVVGFSDPATAGGELAWMDGFARVRFGDWWKSPDGTTAVSTDLRAYLPTNPVRRERGMKTELRAGFSASRKVTETFSFGLDWIPILHVYDSITTVNADGKEEANPIFENRLVLAMNLTLGGGFSLSLPVKHFVKRFVDVGDEAVVNNGVWNHFLSFSPGLSLAVGDNLSVGATYYMGNFVSEGEYGYTLADDFVTQGAFQLSLSLSL